MSIENLLQRVKWTATDTNCRDIQDYPFATHYGVLDIAGHRFRCYRLNDGRAIFHADDVASFFNVLREGQG